MKTLQELYTQIIASDELKKAYLEAAKGGKLAEFLKAQGCEATAEEVAAFLKGKASGELSDAELESAAGGGCYSPSYGQWMEIGYSITTLGTGCAVAAAISASLGYVGQKSKKDNYICNEE